MSKRNYTLDTVKRLRGSLQVEHTLAKRGAEKLRYLLIKLILLKVKLM
jgi:isocitrate lyase